MAFQGRSALGEYNGAMKCRTKGHLAPDHPDTSCARRNNLTLRMGARRLTWLAHVFSEKTENHAHSVAIHAMHHNFVRLHQRLRRATALAAGVATTLQELADMVRSLEEWGARAEERIG